MAWVCLYRERVKIYFQLILHKFDSKMKRGTTFSKA